MKDNSKITGTLRTLFWGYALTAGFVAAVLGCSFMISKTIMPVLLLALAYVVSAVSRMPSVGGRQRCHRMAWTVQATLIWSAFIMLLLLLSHVKVLFGDRFNTAHFNPVIPYITCLVVQTVGSFVSLYALFMGRSLGVCRKCLQMNGEYDNDSLASILFNEESGQQLRMYFWICFGAGAVQWAYFFIFYINVNFNSPDVFVFNFVPVAIYLLSLIYLGSRYYSIAMSMDASDAGRQRVSRDAQLRFIVTSGDRMLLRDNDGDDYDTPYKAEVNFDKPDDARAAERFEAMGGPAGSAMRFLYDNVAPDGERTIHYAAFVSEEDSEKARRNGNWFTLYEVNRFLNSGRLAPMMANEIVRIYTITMAWKTYDRQGRRLYPVKHYKPIFRLRDFKEWDVDYNDPAWMQVSIENEDRMFFHARRFWRKCLNIFNRG